MNQVRSLEVAPTTCSGGGEVQRKSLQNSNTVSSNLTRYSKSSPYSLVPGLFFTTLAQLNRALGYELRGREFESLRWCQILPRNSEAEYRLDKAGVDISKLSVATKFFTQEHSMKHAKP